MITQKRINNKVVCCVLKLAWANYRRVKQSELEEGLMVFDFDSIKDRDRILDMSPWAVHGHCLKL